jgi:hypothetical protein
MIKPKKIKLSIKRRSNKNRLIKRRSNKNRLIKRRSNKNRLNKRRSNKNRLTKRRLNKTQNGGDIFRSTILPIDVVNTGRGISHASGSLMNNLKGISVSPSPYPTLDHPIDNPVSLA